MREVNLYQGDCLEVLKSIGDNSIGSIVTDPPYGLSFMGKKWDYDVPSTEIWIECLRVLKPGGHLLAFAGTRTQHRMAVRIEDAGFEIRDMISWVYGSGFPKSHNLKDEWQGWGTALKPALEPITVARKPPIGTVAENVLAHGTGALNIDGCRVGDFQNTTPSGVDRRNAKLSEMGYRPGEYQMGEKAPNTPPGRWPANLIHDGSDEVVAGFPHSKSGAMKKSYEYKNNGNSLGAPSGSTKQIHEASEGSAARFFYCAKASKKDRDEGLDGFEIKNAHSNLNTKNGTGEHLDGEPTAKRANIHPTVKPTALMRYLCRLVTQPGGVVLDPFMGSGSTGKAAVQEGFNFIGIEREEQYIEIAKARIEAVNN